ncbi:diguanylate cyclase (GGDEF domain) [hydrothermal vent metagenome]|uniref:Diguanylate cyclase (GGDEF domain) n=1 Tax=hydrothermal vent metagenome TaxID=652676 RepID=A0A3B1A8S8_9ZZZZ
MAIQLTESLSENDLVSLELFKSEQESALTWLLPYCKLQTVQANCVILDPKVKNNTLFFVLSGQAEVQLEQQGLKAISYLKPGECIGEMSIIEGISPSAKVVSTQVTTLLTLPGEILWKIIDRSHAVSKNLIYMLSSRIRQDNNVILESLELQQLHEQKSKNDVLTNLFNRRWLDEMLPRIFERYQTQNSSFSIIMLDIDHFKHYNDNYGHLSGDAAIRSIAATITDNIRPNDMAARYGGEEFMVLLPETNKEEAEIIAERLRVAVKTKKIVSENKAELPSITASFGIATSYKNVSLIDLICNADTALYKAKENGRDCIFSEN